jgi:hypothetical protein
MKRPFLNLWPIFIQVILVLITNLIVCCFLPQWIALDIPYTAPYHPIHIFVIFSLVWFWKFRWLWGVSRSVWHFQTVSNRNIILHFDPTLKEQVDIDFLLKQIEGVVDDLALWFDFSLRRRPVVYFFDSWKKIERAFKRQMGGCAVQPLNAIFVANDFPNLQEAIRHEMAHLFSFRWNQKAPPLLSEGLATWLQGTNGGMHIDSAARLCSYHTLNLQQLLRPNFFFSAQYGNACYCLAGSFTGFLIRRCGWRKYRKWYRSDEIDSVRRKFQRVFGLSLEEAESKWQSALTTDLSPSMTVLKQRLERELAVAL